LRLRKLLSYRAAMAADKYYREKAGSLNEVARLGAMAKLKCAKLAVDLGEEVMKIYGGGGLL
jgi:alkylation response protein AidB-like acyl-CoA dehydrogenase